MVKAATGAPAAQAQKAYDWPRVAARMKFALALSAMIVFLANFATLTTAPLLCTGGWSEGLEFLAKLAVAMALIEAAHRIGWFLVTRGQPATRGAGRLALGPETLFYGMLFAVVLCLVASLINYPDACTVPSFSFRDVAGVLVLGYALLAIGNALHSHFQAARS
jgi:hypothetical protein